MPQITNSPTASTKHKSGHNEPSSTGYVDESREEIISDWAGKRNDPPSVHSKRPGDES